MEFTQVVLQKLSFAFGDQDDGAAYGAHVHGNIIKVQDQDRRTNQNVNVHRLRNPVAGSAICRYLRFFSLLYHAGWLLVLPHRVWPRSIQDPLEERLGKFPPGHHRGYHTCAHEPKDAVSLPEPDPRREPIGHHSSTMAETGKDMPARGQPRGPPTPLIRQLIQFVVPIAGDELDSPDHHVKLVSHESPQGGFVNGHIQISNGGFLYRS